MTREDDGSLPTQHHVVKFGTYMIFTPIAIGLSYAKWHSIWWALLHGICGLAYVTYWLVTEVVNRQG
jgi:hypothetical protein